MYLNLNRRIICYWQVIRIYCIHGVIVNSCEADIYTYISDNLYILDKLEILEKIQNMYKYTQFFLLFFLWQAFAM